MHTCVQHASLVGRLWTDEMNCELLEHSCASCADLLQLEIILFARFTVTIDWSLWRLLPSCLTLSLTIIPTAEIFGLTFVSPLQVHPSWCFNLMHRNPSHLSRLRRRRWKEYQIWITTVFRTYFASFHPSMFSTLNAWTNGNLDESYYFRVLKCVHESIVFLVFRVWRQSIGNKSGISIGMMA